MVDERITDGERIAQLLASELSGLAVGPLADVTVTDANTDATPTASGTLAYALTREGDRVGEVYMYPDRVRIELEPADSRRPDGDLDGEGESDADRTVAVESGAAVKRAVDAVRELLVGTNRDPEDGA